MQRRLPNASTKLIFKRKLFSSLRDQEPPCFSIQKSRIVQKNEKQFYEFRNTPLLRRRGGNHKGPKKQNNKYRRTILGYKRKNRNSSGIGKSHKKCS